MTIYAFNVRRSQFKDCLSANKVNSNRYFRLMALAACDMICTVPIALFFLAESVKAGIVPYPSWSAIHANYSEIEQIPAFVWRGSALINFCTEFSRGLQVACAFIFFIFFGFAEEARKNYLSVYSTVAKRVGYSTGSMSSTGMSSSGITSTNGYASHFLHYPSLVLMIPHFNSFKTSSFGKGLISFGKNTPTSPVIVRQDITRVTDRDTFSSFQEKSYILSPVDSDDDIKAHDLPHAA
jgi:hypothetical protein